MKGKLLISVLTALAVLSVLFLVATKRNGDQDKAIVDYGSIRMIISADGIIEPVDEISMASKYSGKISTIDFESGDMVKAGDVVVIMEQTELQRELEGAEAEYKSAIAQWQLIKSEPRAEDLTMAEANVKEMRARLEGAALALENARSLYEQRTSAKQIVDTAQTEVELATAQLEAAKAKWERILKGARPEQILQAEAATKRAEAIYKQSQGNWQRVKRLFEEKAASKEQLEAAQAQMEVAEAEKQMADQKLQELLQGATDEEKKLAQMELKQAQYALEGAKKALDNAKALYEERTQAKAQVDSANTEYKLAEARLTIAEAQYQKLLSGARPLEIDASQAQMKAAEAKVKLIKARLQDATIVSPVSGIVLAKHYNAGEVVAAGSPIIKIANTDKIRVHAEIDETDIERLKVGQKAIITSRAFADRRFEGRVSKIGPQVRDKRVRINDPTLLQNDVKVLESKVELPFEPALKIGLPVEVKIIVKELDNVIIVPRSSLKKEAGRYFVQLITSNGYEKREVEIGEMDYDNAQVIKGLSKGEKVKLKD